MKEILLLSMAVAAVAFAISEARIFAWLRDGRMGVLFECGYCTAFWTAFLFVLLAGPEMRQVMPSPTFFTAVLIVWWLATWQWAVMCWLMKKAGK